MQMFPTDSAYSFRRKLELVDKISYLTCDRTDKSSRFIASAMHPVRQWIAAIDSLHNGECVVWNYKTQEVVFRFQFNASNDMYQEMDYEERDSDIATTTLPTTLNVLSPSALARQALAKTTSPNSSYLRVSRRSSSLQLLFYDFEVIQETAKVPIERTWHNEWLILIANSHIMTFDLNHNGSMRRLSSDEFQKSEPTCITVLPCGMLAIGCQDGRIRLWDPHMWKMLRVVETGLTRELQDLKLLTPMNSSKQSFEQERFVAGLSVDGKLTIWTIVRAFNSWEYVKVSELELKELTKSWESTFGFAEINVHHAHEMLTISTKDGTIYVFDVFQLYHAAKPVLLIGILPSVKASFIAVFAGVKRGSFTIASISSLHSGISFSDMIVKGRLFLRENTSSYYEYACGPGHESKDLSTLIPQYHSKKTKMMSLTIGSETRNEIVCIGTTSGLLVLKASFLSPKCAPILIPRSIDKVPLIALPSNDRVLIRFLEESGVEGKDEYKMQDTGMETALEACRQPYLQSSLSDSTYLSALHLGAAHGEILQMDSELRNQKSITLHKVFSGSATSIAWHTAMNRFAFPQEQNEQNLKKPSNARRRNFIFGRNSNSDDAGSQRSLHNIPSPSLLAVYDIVGEAQIELIDDSFTAGDGHILHIFSGPFLGLVRYELEDVPGSNDTLPDTKSSDSSPNLFRRKRQESGLGAFSPTLKGAQTPPNSTNVAATEQKIKKTWIEFYEWGARSSASFSLCKVGSSIPCPMAIAWESKSNRFCALLYDRKIVIYSFQRIESKDEECMKKLHEISIEKVVCMKWIQYTLFTLTTSSVHCFIMSKTRYFSFQLASNSDGIASASTLPHKDLTILQNMAKFEFPKAQYLPKQIVTIFGVNKEKLLVADTSANVYTIDLTNQVVQCCIYVSNGLPVEALKTLKCHIISESVTKFIASVMEGFGFISEALAVPRLPIRFATELCIKHNRFEELVGLLDKVQTDSDTVMGTSVFQRGCIALYRADRLEPLEALHDKAQASVSRPKDTIFLAAMLGDHKKHQDALLAHGDFALAMYAAKEKDQDTSLILEKWNEHMQLPTASWRSLLDKLHLDPGHSWLKLSLKA
ncbi:unnamed protein product [Albugo candida]|nr:unnamed protein product [Albugo candida]|eukprot:CCI43815.1 unnamed protein product [Albugo candida]